MINNRLQLADLCKFIFGTVDYVFIFFLDEGASVHRGEEAVYTTVRALFLLCTYLLLDLRFKIGCCHNILLRFTK